jgi:polyisoprenoid-binding protein YceI
VEIVADWRNFLKKSFANFMRTAALSLVCATCVLAAHAQVIVLQCDPAQTTANFTLGDVLHTVHGSFKVKRCDLRFDPTLSKVDGEIVFDATSGNSGNASRDRKMEKNVLEANRYPEIAFRPEKVNGNVAPNRRVGVGSQRNIRDPWRRT